MKKEEFNEGMNHIDTDLVDDYITQREALEQQKLKRKPWIRWVSIAACFCVIFIGVFAAYQTGLFDRSMGGNIEPGEEVNPAGDPDLDTDGYVTIMPYSIGNGALYLEYFDMYMIPNEADVVTVCLTECSGVNEIFFRSSDKVAGQTIRKVVSKDGTQIATYKDGVYTFDFLDGQETVCLDIYFDAGTFAKSISTDTEIRDAEADVDYDPDQPIDENHASTTTAAPVVVYFECSVILPDDGYDEVMFSRVYSSIIDEPRILISGGSCSLEEAVNAVGLQALLLFEDYTPKGVTYFQNNELTVVSYYYGINAVVTVRALEYHKIDYTAETFVASTNIFDYELYPYATTSEIEGSGIQYDIYSCYKNEDDFKGEIVVLHYTENGNNIFFVIQFDLYGENANYNVKELMQQMVLVD